ncbi:hypothetical protein [Campylobacter sp. CS_ED2]|nr:hypothetical protein [Campylobacter sp. CS_ED2]
MAPKSAKFTLFAIEFIFFLKFISNLLKNSSQKFNAVRIKFS